MIADAPRSRMRDRAAERDVMLAAGAVLAERCEHEAEVAGDVIRLLGANLGISSRNACLLAANGCPPVETRYFGAWKRDGYRIVKGSHGYPSLVRGAGGGYRIAWRFAAVDVERSKGQGSPFSFPGNATLDVETHKRLLQLAGSDGDWYLRLQLLAAGLGYAVEIDHGYPLDRIDAARLEVVDLRDGLDTCLACGWDGEGDGGCEVCR